MTDTIIYMYYGNSTCASQQNPSGVWDGDYVLVQHLSETSGVHYDSTTYDNDGTPQGGVIQNIDGKLDGADSFDNTNDLISVPDGDSLSFGDGATDSPGMGHILRFLPAIDPVARSERAELARRFAKQPIHRAFLPDVKAAVAVQPLGKLGTAR